MSTDRPFGPSSKILLKLADSPAVTLTMTHTTTTTNGLPAGISDGDVLLSANENVALLATRYADRTLKFDLYLAVPGGWSCRGTNLSPEAITDQGWTVR